MNQLASDHRGGLREPLDVCVKRGLGLQASDAIVGIIYVGTPVAAPRELPRPALEDFVTRWQT